MVTAAMSMYACDAKPILCGLSVVLVNDKLSRYNAVCLIGNINVGRQYSGGWSSNMAHKYEQQANVIRHWDTTICGDYWTASRTVIVKLPSDSI
jgi:hypothetical protein